VNGLDKHSSPFDTIESTQQFNEIFEAAIAEAVADVQRDIATAKASNAERRLEALLLVQHKLEKLSNHVSSSRRVLNDLRLLRRLMFEERTSHRYLLSTPGRE
jgi:hypothetical protein